MTKYKLRIPLTGYLEVIVEALNTDTAYELAVQSVELDPDQPHLVDWDLHKQVVLNNVFQGSLGKYEVEQIED
ncbi:MAG: hypothetical protein PUP93_11365 [Rhizonema sp. NSF051]|nr:hypothetical protein [Rhizonema sp. NSF051]